MLEFLQSRIYLARARICKPFDPVLAEEHTSTSYYEAFSVGFNNPQMEPGALALDEPNVLAGFHVGVGNCHTLQNQQA